MFRITNKTYFFDHAHYISRADAFLLIKALDELQNHRGYAMVQNDFTIIKDIETTLKEILDK